ncbi:multinuclear nonheme iron-dependent oxidase [Acaryochloris marina NIES-2412]|uniref:multinuclear nonheme iron-dependent oxidase n=1 Tax=Acaryochloris marina TaxID=155978 RepID=UPI0040592D03
MTPQIGLSLMPQPDFWQAAQPLFDADAVEVVEWSFDMGWGGVSLPDSLCSVLRQFSQRNGLLGHGVSYSLLSAQLDRRHWLACLQAECRDYSYRHISEHFGWMATQNFSRSAPLPMPLLPETLKLGCDRIQQFAEIAQVPIGLENLAFAFGLQDVRQQGEFLDQLLDPIDGFLLLDLHNLYCQMHNFQLSATEILSLYPLERVRELHLSGGSWSQHGTATIRRDTHDQAVPEPVFELLKLALQQCPQVEVIILERMGNTLNSKQEQLQFRRDFAHIRQITDHVSYTAEARGE